jgi:hypothetical protein
MLSWVIQITVISVVLIFLVHHLIHFFKSTLTVPKIKDLVNRPAQQYENMLRTISANTYQDKNNYDMNINNTNNSNNSSNSNNSNNNYENNANEYTLIDLLPKHDKTDDMQMKNELKNFLKSQLRD